MLGSIPISRNGGSGKSKITLDDRLGQPFLVIGGPFRAMI